MDWLRNSVVIKHIYLVRKGFKIKVLKRDNSYMYALLNQNGKQVGFIVANCHNTKEHNGVILSEFSISHDYRRQRLGTSLIKHAISHCYSLGYNKFALSVWGDTMGIISFEDKVKMYLSLGFYVYERGELPISKEPTAIMKLDIF